MTPYVEYVAQRRRAHLSAASRSARTAGEPAMNESEPKRNDATMLRRNMCSHHHGGCHWREGAYCAQPVSTRAGSFASLSRSSGNTIPSAAHGDTMSYTSCSKSTTSIFS